MDASSAQPQRFARYDAQAQVLQAAAAAKEEVEVAVAGKIDRLLAKLAKTQAAPEQGASAAAAFQLNPLHTAVFQQTHPTAPNYRKQYARFVNTHLSTFNENPNFRYLSDTPYFNIDDYKTQLSSIGFKIENDDILSLSYQGDDPAKALDALLKLNPLILDCKISLNLIDLLFLKSTVGKIKFNQIFKKYSKGKIDLAEMLPFHDQTLHYQYFNDLQTHQDLGELQPGDRVYLVGNPTGFAVHPSSDYNGHNLVVAESGPPPTFRGFDSDRDEVSTMTEVMTFIADEYRKLLTKKDAFLIYQSYKHDPEGRAPYCPFTNSEIFNSFNSLDTCELLRYSGEFLKNPNDGKSLTTIAVPDRFQGLPALGLTVTTTFNPKAFGRFIHNAYQAESMLKTVHKPVIVPPKETGFSADGFETQARWQEDLQKVVGAFYDECVSETEPKPGGLILYGNAGTGKTHLCTAVTKQLQAQGKIIYTQGYDDAVLSSDDYVRFLEIKDVQERIEAVQDFLATLLPNPLDADVFFIDDVNQTISEHQMVTQALLDYAIKHNKKVLINANTDPFKTLKQFGFNGFFKAYPVHGPDHRVAHAWHQGLKPSPAGPLSLTLDDGDSVPFTDDQQEIAAWMDILDQQTKASGLLVAGAPGTGKSTAIRSYLTDQGKSFTTLNRQDLETFSFDQLATSDYEYLVIEDVNEVSFLNRSYKDLFRILCNSEGFRNQDGQLIKIILTSNKQDSGLVESLASDLFLKELGPRMISRFQSMFKVISLSSQDDLRQTFPHQKGWVTATLDRSSLGEHAAFELNIHDFNKEMQKYADLMNKATAVSATNASAYLKDFDPKTHPCTLKTEYRQSLIHQARTHQQIVIHWNEKPSFAFESIELLTLLDLMEDENKELIIVHPTPHSFLGELKALIESKIDHVNQGKYLSRIQRFEVSPDTVD